MRSGITLRNNLLPWVILSLWSLIIDIVRCCRHGCRCRCCCMGPTPAPFTGCLTPPLVRPSSLFSRLQSPASGFPWNPPSSGSPLTALCRTQSAPIEHSQISSNHFRPIRVFPMVASDSLHLLLQNRLLLRRSHRAVGAAEATPATLHRSTLRRNLVQGQLATQFK
jgi:hypothetical protein